VVDIRPAEYDLRLKILEKKCALARRSIPHDVLAFLASNITSNIRELEGALHRLIAYAELSDLPLTVASAEDSLKDILRAGGQRLSVENIQKKTAAHYKISLADMLSASRARAFARPRQVAMYLAKTLTENSLPDIGRSFGGRDHTTVMHALRQVEKLKTADVSFAEEVEGLKRSFAG